MISQQDRLNSQSSLGSLLDDLRKELSHLTRTTTRLLRVELEENCRNVGDALRSSLISAAAMTLGVLFAFLGINLLAIALLAPDILSYETAAWVCTLSTSGVLLFLGMILRKRAQNKLTPDKIIPKKTLATIEEHAEWVAKQAEEIAK